MKCLMFKQELQVNGSYQQVFLDKLRDKCKNLSGWSTIIVHSTDLVVSIDINNLKHNIAVNSKAQNIP